MKQNDLPKKLKIFTILIVVVGIFSPISLAKANVNEVLDIVFPVQGGGPYINDFDQPRSGGRTHMATDITGPKMQPLLAAVDGKITFLPNPEPSYGWTLTITDSDGYQYNYLHLNNDNPGTDDGKGGYNNAFAAGIKLGSRVSAGQLIGFMGDSGNAEETVVHLHFEIESPDGEKINPYFSLQQATVLNAPVDGDNTNDIEIPESQSPKPKTGSDIFPYDIFEGGANVVTANLDTDKNLEIVTGTAFGGGGRTIIKGFEQDGSQKFEWFAYGDVFRGGVDVAAADVDGDKVDEIITAPGPGGGPHIKIFKSNGQLVSEFMAYDGGFHGGVYVSAADVDGDGQIEIVTAPNFGGGPHVKVFEVNGTLKAEWMAYDGGFAGGIDVSAFAPIGKVLGGIATAPGVTGGPHVKVFDVQGNLQSEFFAWNSGYFDGLRITGGNLKSNNGIMEVAVVGKQNTAPKVKLYTVSGEFLREVDSGLADTWRGGYDIAGADSWLVFVTSGGMKTTLKQISRY
ncbi:MAG: VCBS repeat domain-containing M23 family metallopeptidase [Candidatus Doudnabacteria bacterium]